MLANIPKGTKDLLPEESYKWQYIEKKFQDVCRLFGYKEIRTPLFEHTELFKRGIGDTSDVVQKEMYTFNDRADRSLTLKPEGTAPVVRSFIENKLYAETQPIKMYYNTSCFRYEKPQAGRYRQFHQFGIEVFGTNSMLADAEVISLADTYLRELGLKKFELRINSIGCPECRNKYKKALQDFLKPNYDKLCDTCKTRYEKNPMRIIDCKSKECQALLEGVPVMIDYLCDDCKTAFEELKTNLDILNIKYEVDPGIVRGLDYYTKTAFEFIAGEIGAQSAVCGGGRYDNLISELDGPDTPGVGFGLGIERLLLTMETEGIEIPKPQSTQVFVAFLGDRAKKLAIEICNELRKKNISAEMDILERNLKGQFKYSDRINAEKTIVIGDDEIDKGVVQLRDMKKSSQEEVPVDKLMDILSK